MKVLFVSSGKSGSVGDIVKNQRESLKAAGIEIDYYIIKSGLFGYLSAVLKIRKIFKVGEYDLAHAHYSFSGFAASIAGCSPLVVSLMGSDAFMSGFLRNVAKFFYKYKWNATIVKTIQMKELLGMKKAEIIPNGVDINRFKPRPKNIAREYLDFPQNKNLVLFISIPNRPEKNSELAEIAVKGLNDPNVELIHIYNIPNENMPFYYNAADALLLTSKWEGSVNVVKEAMACNCPIVSTDVGDVRWVVGETEGCYISSSDYNDIAEKIKSALAFSKRTQGRERMANLGLDSGTVAMKIKELYYKVLNNSTSRTLYHIKHS